MITMGSELDVFTLALSMTFTLYLLITHVLYHCRSLKASRSNNSGGTASTRNLYRRQRHSECLEFGLILTFITLDVAYFILKYRAHLGAEHLIECSKITAAYLSVMATSIWTVELFFLVRGWKILREMSHHAQLLEIDRTSLKLYDGMCRIGIVFVVLCAITTVVLVAMLVDYEEVDGLCVPTGKYQREIMLSAFSLMACAVVTGVVALFAFAKPLVQYQAALVARSMSYAADSVTADHDTIRRSDSVRTSLKHTLIRVCACLCAVHVMFVISGVFHVLVNEPGSWGYGSRKLYRSLYCACSVLMILSMMMTYKNWKLRVFPFACASWHGK